MILFSRIRGAVGEIERREWALLSLETVGVLAGILIAFQLQEWATSRKEAARDRKVVERLFGEAQENVARLRDQREWSNALAAREITFATQLVRDRMCPPEELWQSVYTVAWYPPLHLENSVYQEMMGAGGLTTIDDPAARTAVSRFHARLAWTIDRVAIFRSRAQPAVPIDDPRVTVSFDPDASERLLLSFDRAALCADTAFKKRAADTVRDHAMIIGERSQLVDSAIQMCATLGRIIGQQCRPPRGGELTGRDLQIANAASKNAAP